jgi:hypothetical protein
MATDLQQDNEKPQQTNLLFTHKQLKLESLQLVWLDYGLEEQTTTSKLLQKLRKTYDYTHYFSLLEECSRYIEENTITTLLVYSATLAELLLSQVHYFTHIHLVYIYSTLSEREKNRSQELLSKFSKVS